jgi:hypothetical protein
VSLIALTGHDAETSEGVCLETTNPDIADSGYRDVFKLYILADKLADAATADQKNDEIMRITKTRDSFLAWPAPPQQKPAACTFH